VADLPFEVEERNLLRRGRDGGLSDGGSHKLGGRSSRSGGGLGARGSAFGSGEVLDDFAIERLDGGLVAAGRGEERDEEVKKRAWQRNEGDKRGANPREI
jgi:hypothetical protein